MVSEALEDLTHAIKVNNTLCSVLVWKVTHILSASWDVQ